LRNTAYKKLNSDLKLVYSDNDTLSMIFQNKMKWLLGVVGN
jgi:hypothetical protein